MRSSTLALKVLIITTFVCGALTSDNWAEVADELHPPSPTPNAALKSPLFLQSQSSDSQSGAVLGFNEMHYHQIKGMVNQGTFLMENFVDNSAGHLELEASHVFADGAAVHHMNADGTETIKGAPEMITVSGRVQGDDSSLVLINMSPKGSLGFVHSSDKKIAIERGHAGHAVLIDASASTSDDPATAQDKATAKAMESAPDNIRAPLVPPNELLLESAATEKNVINIAVECDQRCGEVIRAAYGDPTEYLTAVIAGASVIYARDLGRQLKISYARIWDRASPFNRGTASLNELGSYYVSTMYGKQTYDVAHLFTGIYEGGLAYLGTVCSGSSGLNTGVSSIRGKWKGTQKKSAYNWDLIVTTHELGHNMGSGHSHSYNPPIDQCVSCAGAAPGQSCGGSAAQPVSRTDPKCVRGTIMSYCHLCGGDLNIDMKFHPRAIAKIKANMNYRCGTAGSLPPTAVAPSIPTSQPTPAPPCVDKRSAWGFGGCAKLLKTYPTCRVNLSGKSMADVCYKTCSGCVNSGGGGSSPVAATRRRRWWT